MTKRRAWVFGVSRRLSTILSLSCLRLPELHADIVKKTSIQSHVPPGTVDQRLPSPFSSSKLLGLPLSNSRDLFPQRLSIPRCEFDFERFRGI